MLSSVGTVSEIRGDGFGPGALAAGISAGFAPAIDMIGEGAPDYQLARVAVSAAIGGTAAEIGGGKFANWCGHRGLHEVVQEEISMRSQARGGDDPLHIRIIRSSNDRYGRELVEMWTTDGKGNIVGYVDTFWANTGENNPRRQFIKRYLLN